MIHRELHQQNRLAWDAATRAHSSHKRDMPGFLRAGGTTLFDEEVHLLLGTGPDGPALTDILARGTRPLAGQTLLHAPCNAGQDSLSLVSLGAEVTGVDISEVAITTARALSADSGLPARFECADLYDWLPAAAAAGQRFDLTFMSYGVLLWMSDLDAFVAGMAALLRPGGRFVGLEFHPFLLMYDEQGRLAYPYAGGGHVISPEGIGDYVAASGEGLAPSGYLAGEVGFRNPHATHEFSWGVADLITAILRAGLQLELVREYPFANGCRVWHDLAPQPGRRFAPSGPNTPPMMLGWSARRPESP